MKEFNFQNYHLGWRFECELELVVLVITLILIELT